ncbi:MAG: protein kinase [Myxococcota bacterium]|nr:protein kinase [Myxococcota bacterium]
MEKVGLQQAADNERLGSYEIIRRLARGGMAELFLARTVGPQGFEKVVALKKILPKYADRPRWVQLFTDEARLAASLSHANIVQVNDIGVDAGRYFFAMEYLHGQDVRTILHRVWRERQKLPVRFAVQIATQIAAALDYAHNMRKPDGSLVNIVHRDVSPSNIIVTYDGAVKLLDFGVAKASTRTVKTRTGTLKGKISYMSPEQAKGAPVDRRSDIFSLGILLWEMVTTTRLFRGENDLATLQLIINVSPRRPSEVQPECPPELERIILKALSQDVATRYQTADELMRDLETFSLAHDIGQSATALSSYVSALFEPEISSWREACAAGIPLAEHLTYIGDMTEEVGESEFIEAIDVAAMLAAEEAEQAAEESFDERGGDRDDDEDEDDDDDDDAGHTVNHDEPSTLVPGEIVLTAADPDPRVAPPRVALPPARRPSVPPASVSAASAIPMIGDEMPTLTSVDGPPTPPANPWPIPMTASEASAQGSSPSNPWPLTSSGTYGSSPSAPAPPFAVGETWGSRLARWARRPFPVVAIDAATATRWERWGVVIAGGVIALIILTSIISAF